MPIAVTLITFLFISAINASGFNKLFKESAHKLADYITRGDAKNSGLRWLEPLVDDFGSRHLGSKALEDAIDYTLSGLRADGFDNVHTEPVDGLPHWIRGDDEVTMIEPRTLRLNALTVGGVTEADVTAEVVVLTDFDQLENANISGRIVLFAQSWEGYSRTARYRKSAAGVQARGAVGVLVKSVGPFSLSTPHTGSGVPDATIPAICLTIEEAELLERFYRRDRRVVVRMNIRSNVESPVTSRNTVFDIRGSEWPEEIILLSGHIDSWDVGQGALDDGGGLAAVWQAMKSILTLGRRGELVTPRRTIRGVFWTAEEQGFLGAKHYYDSHQNNNNETFFFVSETDQGAFRPNTYNSHLKFLGSEKHKKRLEEIVELLNSYGIPLSLVPSKSQGDAIFWANDGVPSINYVSERGIDYYFYFHHTQADYLNVFKEGDIDYTAAIFGVIAHVLANMDSWD